MFFLSECEVCKDFDDARHAFLLLCTTRFLTFIHFSHDNLSQIHINDKEAVCNKN